jgi:hypothetical protein
VAAALEVAVLGAIEAEGAVYERYRAEGRRLVPGHQAIAVLSQDRDPESYCRIIEKLKERGEDGRKIAAVMEGRMKDLFPEDGVA